MHPGCDLRQTALFQGLGGEGEFERQQTGQAFGSGGPAIRDFDGVSLGGGNSEARFAASRQIQIDRDGDGLTDRGFPLDGASLANQSTAMDFVWSSQERPVQVGFALTLTGERC